jgi:phage shock protein C
MIYRSRTDRWLGGVLGGIALGMNWDSFLLRLIYLIFFFMNPWIFGLLYGALWLLMR